MAGEKYFTCDEIIWDILVESETDDENIIAVVDRTEAIASAVQELRVYLIKCQILWLSKRKHRYLLLCSSKSGKKIKL